MKFGKLLRLICLSLLLINVSMTVQAEENISEITEEAAVASLTLKDSTVLYYDSVCDAFKGAQGYKECTLRLLKSVKFGSDLNNHIMISSGEFTFDLNGNTLDFTKTDNYILIQGGKITFTDSSNGAGTIKGKSIAVYVKGDGHAIIKGGNYVSKTWAVWISRAERNAILEITGGRFEANEGLHVESAQSVNISGGEFYGTGQAAVVNTDIMTIKGGTFYGGIENFSGARLDFYAGTIIVSDAYNAMTRLGIENDGTLNLYGGNIQAAEDMTRQIAGISNNKDATLNLYKDVNFQRVEVDFELEETMNICGDLEDSYRVKMYMPSGGTSVVFAKAGTGIQLDKTNFVSAVSGYEMILLDDGSSLSLSKCYHTKMDDKFICKGCGLQMCAQIGNTYYPSLADAFAAAEESTASDNLAVRLLADVSENAQISGGNFSLDLNGNAIEAALSVGGGNVILKGTGADDEYIRGLYIKEDADAEISGITIKGYVVVSDSATFTMTEGKIIGEEVAVANMGGTMNLLGGKISAEEIAVLNLMGTATIGTEEGTGPSIDAPVGIVNGKLDVEANNQESVLNINGGVITAETDIQNKTGTISEISLKAGVVNIKGGTFVDGLSVVLDEDVDLADLLVKGYGYYGSDGQKISVEEGAVLLNQTVTVKKPAKDVVGELGEVLPDQTVTVKKPAKDVAGELDEGTTNSQEIRAANTGDAANIVMWLVCFWVSGVIISRKIRRYN